MRPGRWPVRITLLIWALLLAVALVAVALVAVAVAGASPEATGALLMLGSAAAMILYGVIYYAQRRRHW